MFGQWSHSPCLVFHAHVSPIGDRCVLGNGLLGLFLHSSSFLCGSLNVFHGLLRGRSIVAPCRLVCVHLGC